MKIFFKAQFFFLNQFKWILYQGAFVKMEEAKIILVKKKVDIALCH